MIFRTSGRRRKQDCMIERRNPVYRFSPQNSLNSPNSGEQQKNQTLNANLAARKVLQAISVEIAAGIGGRYWAEVEHRRFEGPTRFPTMTLVRAIGVNTTSEIDDRNQYVEV